MRMSKVRLQIKNFLEHIDNSNMNDSATNFN